MSSSRAWVEQAIRKIEADFNRSADTHLIPLLVPGCSDIGFYFKDESIHPTGSLKHRLARSLFLYGLCNGWIVEGRPIIESSSGSTAVSEAYFARLLGLPFIAVMPRGTSEDKIRLIEFMGGKCHLIDQADNCSGEAQRLANETGGHFMDQFTFAERATDWRGNNSVAETIFRQMTSEPHPIPSWIVVGAGTGGTSATLGRYVRYQRYATRICVVDPETSVFGKSFRGETIPQGHRNSSVIEGIGRSVVPPSFIARVVDRVIDVPDVVSIAGVHFLAKCLNRRCGGSTGTNLAGVCQLAAEMKSRGESGSIVTLICDPGDRYGHTYYDDAWLKSHGMDIAPHVARFERFFSEGRW